MLISLAQTFVMTNTGAKYKGYIEEVQEFPEFHMCLFLKEQFECINSIPYSNRILYFDATRGLVKVPKNKFGELILNYICLLKDIKK